MAHQFDGLADEYIEDRNLVYTGPEPATVNITTSPTGDKWARWLGYVEPKTVAIGPVGAYEGAWWGQGIYRPTEDSRMGPDHDLALNAIGREKVILDIYSRVRPLDAWADNSAPLTDPATLWVDAVDPQVIKVQWSVDDVALAGATSENLDLADFVLPAGQHTVKALAYDDTDWVRLQTDLLHESVVWSVVITVPEPTVLAIVCLGALACLHRT